MWTGWAIFNSQFLLGFESVLNFWLGDDKAQVSQDDLFFQFEKLESPELNELKSEVINSSMQLLREQAQLSGIDWV